MATTNIKRATSASRLVNYAEKEPSKKTVTIFKSIMLKLNLSKFVKFSETLAVRKPMPVDLHFRLMNLTQKARKTS